jgi:hypothetical protein
MKAERVFSRKYNRWFGMHNPFGGDMGKAGDPYVNLWSLARLSHKEQIHKAIARNIIDRFKQGREVKRLREAVRLGIFGTGTEEALFKEDDCPADLLSAFLESRWIQATTLEEVVTHKNAPGGEVIIRFCKEVIFCALHDKECSKREIPDDEREALEKFPEYAFRAPMKRTYPERERARQLIGIILDKAKHLTAEEREELERMLKDAPPAKEAIPAVDPQRKQLRDEIRRRTLRERI